MGGASSGAGKTSYEVELFCHKVEDLQHKIGMLWLLLAEVERKNLPRLVQLVDEALLFHPSPGEKGFDHDLGLHENPEYTRTIRRIQKHFDKIVSSARKIYPLVHRPKRKREIQPQCGEWQPKELTEEERKARWRDAIDPLRNVIADLISPGAALFDGDNATKVDIVAQALEILGASKPHSAASRGRPLKAEDVELVVRAVCVFRYETGLPIQYDSRAQACPRSPKCNKGECATGECYVPSTHTAAMIAAVCQVWGVEFELSDIRRGLDRYRKYLTSVGRKGNPCAADIGALVDESLGSGPQ